MYSAYEALSDGMKELLEGLTALHSASRAYGAESRTSRRKEQGSQSMDIKTGDEAESTVEHPVVCTHPDTGRKGLFVNHVFTQRFKGWTKEESQPLLGFPLCPCGASGIHLPLQMARRVDRVLGQPLCSALRAERLSRPTARDAPGDGSR